MNREMKIKQGLNDHLADVLKLTDKDHLVGVFLQGSQNYHLDYELSDIDTKVIVTPTLKDIVTNHKPISTTELRANNEHMDFKDIRLYIETFKKCNLNFLEILFTPYTYINEKYSQEWNVLVENREEIAHYDQVRAVRSMKGIAAEKFFAMEHKYPSKIGIIEKYGYDPKQLHHLLRIEEYLTRYIAGESFEDCLLPKKREWLMEVKRGEVPLKEARVIAQQAFDNVSNMEKEFVKNYKGEVNTEVNKIFEEVQFSIVKKSLVSELK